MAQLEIVRFAPKKGVNGFHDALRRNVDNYFATTGLSPYRNTHMLWKTVSMIAMYLVPYFAILAGVYAIHPSLFYLCWIAMGMGMIGIGCSVMHDGNHGAYTGRKGRDKFIGLIIHLVGGNDITWRIQHNILHHTYTNIDGLDQDIDAGILLRFTPHSRKVPMHRYQHLYAWFVYGIMTLYWCTAKDFMGVISYHKMGLLKKERISLRTALLEVTLSKLLYFSITLVLPILISGAPWTSVLWGFLGMHFIAGLSLACIFQLAHVMEESEFAKPNDEGKMQSSWAVHQLENTVNFAPKNKLLNWFIGGLNYQIEHHLFPHICHVHYPKISPIVAQTAKEHGLQYQVRPTFMNALAAHAHMLKELGK